MARRGGLKSTYDPTQPTLWQRLDWLARRLVPVGLTLILLMMSVAPSRLPGFVHIAPMIALISIYYWAVCRPEVMGYGSAFVLGLVEDSLTGAPLGVGALVLLLTQAVVATQYKFFLNKPFLVTWWAFALVAGVAAVVKWLAVSAIYGTFVDGTALVFSTLFTVAVYPPFAWLFGRVHHMLFREA
ncbi:rod shape-determining protein MreD [Rhodospirillum rubrum]|uniref:rod shape-determining protein MreD n=1 Tax=Rhodospirillum rubrum TaxID=1085 RepID=UPI001906583B|nr:rod shape-determining protein MreD [Rhodospirillum rubrum]MBK1663366.1 rod shape-determining protein MreD [Rhodospirillum rubrum]MBK1675538.1 rod shape-determining protein MreD [Rhodospirillum rubrum]